MLLVAEDQEGVGGNDQDPVVGCGCSAVLVKKLGAARKGGSHVLCTTKVCVTNPLTLQNAARDGSPIGSPATFMDVETMKLSAINRSLIARPTLC